LKPRPPGNISQARIFSCAIRLLAAKPRSEAKLRQLLTQKTGAAGRLIEDCLARLKEIGLVDDYNFAYNYARHRLERKSLGRSRLARELASEGVARDVIERALEAAFEENQEQELIERAIEKYIRTRGRPEGPRGLRRMFNHLIRLGFDRDLIVSRLCPLELDRE
jgi:regulatory protein